MILLAGLNASLSFANIHVCNIAKQIPDFYASKLFDDAIINGTAIDYYVFKSQCDASCFFKRLNTFGVHYEVNANNISFYNQISVATLTIDKIKNSQMEGYMTCSSSEKRQYINLPFNIDAKKVLLDLQTRDGNIISRSLTIGAYSITSYRQLKEKLQKQSSKSLHEVGFLVYHIKGNHRNEKVSVRLGNLDARGGFMMIVELQK